MLHAHAKVCCDIIQRYSILLVGVEDKPNKRPTQKADGFSGHVASKAFLVTSNCFCASHMFFHESLTRLPISSICRSAEYEQPAQYNLTTNTEIARNKPKRIVFPDCAGIGSHICIPEQ